MRTETAVARATTNVPVVAPTDAAGAVRRLLAGKAFESVSQLAVCQQDKFVGMLSMEVLLAAPADTCVNSLMECEPPVIAPGADQEIAAWRAVSKGQTALAVVDAAGRFMGIIPPRQLLTILLSEHEEDLSRLGGFLHGSSAARLASQEPVARRFQHRLPWLLVGIVGALFAADLVSWFEQQLQTKITLAFFIPTIVYLADAVGTQTETVVVRGLSVGIRIHDMLWRELLAGGVIGITIGVLAGLLVYWHWGDWNLAACIAVSLCLACSIAAVSAMLLPWLFDRMGFDPAFGSGPLTTVIQDLLSIIIYFTVAARMML